MINYWSNKLLFLPDSKILKSLKKIFFHPQDFLKYYSKAGRDVEELQV